MIEGARRVSVWLRRVGLAVGLLAAFGVAHPSAALAITIGGTEYAVLGIGGNDASHRSSFEIYQSDTVINGNVGEGPFTFVTHGVDATINGKWFFDTATDKCGSLPCGTTTSTRSPFPGP